MTIGQTELSLSLHFAGMCRTLHEQRVIQYYYTVITEIIANCTLLLMVHFSFIPEVSNSGIAVGDRITVGMIGAIA